MGEMTDFFLDLNDPFEDPELYDQEDEPRGCMCHECGEVGLEWGQDDNGEMKLYTPHLTSIDGRPYTLHKCEEAEIT